MSRQMHFWVDEPYKPTFDELNLAAGHLLEFNPKDPFMFCKVMGLAYEHIMAAAKLARDGYDFYVRIYGVCS